MVIGRQMLVLSTKVFSDIAVAIASVILIICIFGMIKWYFLITFSKSMVFTCGKFKWFHRHTEHQGFTICARLILLEIFSFRT